MLLEIIQKIQVEEEEAEALIGREVGRERLQLQAEMELQFSKFTRLGLLSLGIIGTFNLREDLN